MFVATEAEASLLSTGSGRIRRTAVDGLEGGSPITHLAATEVAVRRSSQLNGRRGYACFLPVKGKEGGNQDKNQKVAHQTNSPSKGSVSTQAQVTSAKVREQKDKRLTIRIPAQHSKSNTLRNTLNIEGSQVPLRNSISHQDSISSQEFTAPFLSIGGLDIQNLIEGKYGQDEIFKTVIEKPKEHKNFELEGNLLYIKLEGSKVLCVPDINHNSRKLREMLISEAHSLLAHLGPRKTLVYLRDHVWWKNIVKDTSMFCESCITCRRSKPSNQKPYGLLNLLKTPSRPWESIGIDFVGPLPESSNRNGAFDTITAVIDRLTGMIHLIPSRQTFNARQIAEMLFGEVYWLHGIPKSIISDRDTLFNSTFWRHLHELVGVKLHMSSAYHPESDGATEWANRTITQMLRQCVDRDQRNWVNRLPAIEFAINSAQSEVTGYAPFFLNYGYVP
jgi:hypothetical protein